MRIKKNGYFLYLNEQNQSKVASFYNFNDDILNETKELPIEELCFEASCELDNFDFLRNYNSLKKVVIDFEHKKIPIDIFNELSSLEDIGLPKFEGVFSNPNTQYFGYKWEKKSCIDKKCTGLRKIIVISCKDTNSLFAQLEQLPKLEQLTLLKSNLDSFPADKNLNGLKELQLLYASKLLNFEGLEFMCPKLKILELQNLRNVASYKNLGGLKHLEKLTIAKSAPINDLSFLNESSNLKTLNIVNTKILSSDLEILKNIKDFNYFGTGIGKKLAAL